MGAATSRRIRLDQLLVERGLAPTRARAQALVLAGKVRVGLGDAARHDLKAGNLVDVSVAVDVAAGRAWVSRGAHKLIAGLDAFGIDPSGLVCLDVGASTGGFTRSTPSSSGTGSSMGIRGHRRRQLRSAGCDSPMTRTPSSARKTRFSGPRLGRGFPK